MIVALYPELTKFGGVQQAGRLLAAALTAISEKRGLPFRALSLNDAEGEHESSVGDFKFHFQGFGASKVQFVLAALRIAPARPRIILAAHPNLSPVSAVLRTLARKSKFIVCAHGIEVWRPLSYIRRQALRGADWVLAPSSDTQHKLIAVQHIANEKTHVLPWPLDPDFLLLANDPDKLPVPECFPRGIVVLTVGRWSASEQYKGADLLIKSMTELVSQFPDLHLVLVSSGDDLPRLRKLAKDSGCFDRIHFLTNLTREALAACYASADIFALPSSGEGFGFVFLEAMAMRKPVIGAGVGGITDIIEDGDPGFLIDPRNPSSLTDALRKLLSSPGLRRQMGERGGQVVRTRFTFSSFLENLRSLLSDENRD